MSEPAGPISLSLVGAAVAVLGPVLGPYALIVFAAGVGALLALANEKTETRWDGVKFVLLSAAIALLITGPIVWAVATYLHVPGNIALVPVAFVLGAGRAHLLSIVNTVLDAAAAGYSAFLQAAANRGRGGGQ